MSASAVYRFIHRSLLGPLLLEETSKGWHLDARGKRTFPGIGMQRIGVIRSGYGRPLRTGLHAVGLEIDEGGNGGEEG